MTWPAVFLAAILLPICHAAVPRMAFFSGEGLQTVAMDGTDVQTLVSLPGCGECIGLSIDSERELAIWADTELQASQLPIGHVYRLNISKALTSPATPEKIGTVPDQRIRDLTIDASTGMGYYGIYVDKGGIRVRRFDYVNLPADLEKNWMSTRSYYDQLSIAVGNGKLYLLMLDPGQEPIVTVWGLNDNPGITGTELDISSLGASGNIGSLAVSEAGKLLFSVADADGSNPQVGWPVPLYEFDESAGSGRAIPGVVSAFVTYRPYQSGGGTRIKNLAVIRDGSGTVVLASTDKLESLDSAGKKTAFFTATAGQQAVPGLGSIAWYLEKEVQTPAPTPAPDTTTPTPDTPAPTTPAPGSTPAPSTPSPPSDSPAPGGSPSPSPTPTGSPSPAAPTSSPPAPSPPRPPPAAASHAPDDDSPDLITALIGGLVGAVVVLCIAVAVLAIARLQRKPEYPERYIPRPVEMREPYDVSKTGSLASQPLLSSYVPSSPHAVSVYEVPVAGNPPLSPPPNPDPPLQPSPEPVVRQVPTPSDQPSPSTEERDLAPLHSTVYTEKELLQTIPDYIVDEWEADALPKEEVISLVDEKEERLSLPADMTHTTLSMTYHSEDYAIPKEIPIPELYDGLPDIAAT